MYPLKNIIFTAIALISFFSSPAVSYARPHDGPTSAPTASPAGGTYCESQTVTITPPSDALQTYYTLDGTEPNNYNNGLLVTDPIDIPMEVGVTIILKSRSYIGDSTAGPLMTEEYFFVAKTDDNDDDDVPPTKKKSSHNKYFRLYKEYRDDYRNTADKDRHKDMRRMKNVSRSEFMRLKNVYEAYRLSGKKERSRLPSAVQNDFKKYQAYHGYHKYLYYKDKANQ